MTISFQELASAGKSIVPVIALPSLDCAQPLADTLSSCGFHVLEITLRTDCALEAIKLLSDTRPDLVIGAGTVVGEWAARSRGATPSRRRHLHKFSRRSARRRRPLLLLHHRRRPRPRTPTRRSASWRCSRRGGSADFLTQPPLTSCSMNGTCPTCRIWKICLRTQPLSISRSTIGKLETDEYDILLFTGATHRTSGPAGTASSSTADDGENKIH